MGDIIEKMNDNAEQIKINDTTKQIIDTAEPTKQEIEQLTCPIGHDLFGDPVLAEDGHFYERNSIENWFRHKNTSPMTNLKIGKTLISSVLFNNILSDF